VKRASKKYLFAGGGTGGHLFPAIAIADEVKKLQPNAEILFIGTKNKIEACVLPQKEYNFRTIWISGFQRFLRLENILFPIKVKVAMLQSLNIINKFKPDVVIGTGGYVCGPVLFAASLMGVKTVIHESNSFPGIVTRLLSKRMDRVFLTFEETKKWLKTTKNTEVTGNPTREIIGKISKEEGIKFFELDENKKKVLVFGGSLGAVSINNAILKFLDTLIQNNVQLIWQTGEKDYDRINLMLSEKKLDNSKGIWTGKFIDKMEYAYAAADVVVCRSGATTIAELTRAGKPAILVPYPYAAADHQTINARTLADADAALMVTDKDTGSKLGEMILNLVKDENLCKEMSGKSLKLGKPDAALVIANKIIDIG
jgi:UDP-N-acetylglucosamine--N-acetylmuramyl-(pentapeptide) pyrophosphoryl-undecaprenol N-acetylglucosamine transferase